ncbi:MAG: hypothetical protein AAB577_00060, partial [Patescibacteria group bacterium]
MSLGNQKNWKKVKNKRIKIKPGFITLAEVAKNTPYSQEYLSLLARQGKLPAKKFGRNWYATQEALDSYLTGQGLKVVLPKNFFNTSYKGKITKAFNFFPFADIDYQKIPKAVLAQSPPPERIIDLSGALGGKPEKKDRGVEPPVQEEFPKMDGQEEIKERQGREAEPQMVKTMLKDIVALGGTPELEIKEFLPKKIDEENVFQRMAVSVKKILPKNIKIKIKIFEKKSAEIPGAGVIAAESAAPLIEEKEKAAPFWGEPRPEDSGREVPVEEKVLERLLRVMEARMPPREPVKHYFYSNTPKAVIVSVIAIVVILLLVGGASFGNLDKTAIAIHDFFKDAVTLQGSQPGTHANEVLLLDKNGNISIYGHIETKGQIRSWVEQGIAPITVVSTTTVENLNADYLDNLSSQDFTLAFVTKNGNITYEDVKLEGNVEVGKTLMVKGATKLLDSLFVYGNLGVFGDTEIRGLTKALGGIVTQGANLNLGSGTIVTTNRNLVSNFNADMVDSMNASDFDLNFITSNGNNTPNKISVGGLNTTGFFGQYGSFRMGGEREIGLIDTKNWSIGAAGHLYTKGSIKTDSSLTIGGQAKFTGTPGTVLSGATIYINPASADSNTVLLGLAVNGTEKFKVDAEGDVTMAGDALITGATTFSGNVVLASPANLTLNAGNLTVNRLATSTGVSATATTSSSGTLAAGTYYYVVTTLNNNGETSSSTEVSATTDGATTTAVNISWSAVSGASSYRVYGRTSGAQNQYWGTTATSLIDTGTSGTASAVPTGNTTGGSGTFYTGLSILGTTISRSILPETASFYNLGSPTYTWSNIYVDNLIATSTTFSGNITMADDKWIGLGSSAGRLVFDDQTPDYLTFQAARLGVATTSPRFQLDVWGSAGFGTTSDLNVPVFFVDSNNQKVGVASSTPSEAFSVAGNIMGSGNIVIYGTATSTMAGPLIVNINQLVVNQSGNVGIGNAAPTSKLTVNGGDFVISSAGSATTTISSATSTFAGPISGGGNQFIIATTTSNILIQPYGGNVGIASSTPSNTLSVQGTISGSGNINFFGASATTTIGGGLIVGTNTLWAPTGGYVGIASSTPSAQFAVQGNILGVGNIVISGTINTGQGATEVYLMDQPVRTTDSVTFGNLALTYGLSAATSTITATSTLSSINADSGLFYVDAYANRIGMATSSPRYLLDVWGDMAVGTSTGTNVPAFYVDSGNGGQVGIGTTTPQEALHIIGNILGSGNLTIAGNLMPNAPQIRDIGSAAYDWQNIYVNNVYANNINAGSTTVSGTTLETFTINSDTAADATSTLRFYRGSDTPHAVLTWDAGYDRFNFNFPLYLSGTGNITAATALNFTGNAASVWKTT